MNEDNKTSSSDKRKVSTDALETLGTVIGQDEKRDAIHLAVIPMEAHSILGPGDHVTARGSKVEIHSKYAVGIVDPFLDRYITPGEWFWLVIYPRNITSLRHVWSHPSFPEENKKSKKYKPNKMDEFLNSKIWMEKYVSKLNDKSLALYGGITKLTVERIIEDAKKFIESKGEIKADYFFDSVHFECEFWKHYEIITGTKVDSYIKEDGVIFFTCTC